MRPDGRDVQKAAHHREHEVLTPEAADAGDHGDPTCGCLQDPMGVFQDGASGTRLQFENEPLRATAELARLQRDRGFA
jgi:hypothetical protein